jgi:Rieske Fe-S protein
MTSGTVSAIIIAEEILGKKNPWAEFFSPERKGRVSKGTSSFISENFNVATQYVKKAVSRETLEFVTDIVEGEGKVTEYGGKKVALYKDEKGEIHMVSPTCTHLGCQVNWNQAEKTWDCPCHGSRYAANGEVIHSPAIQPLKNEDTRPEETKE